MSTLHDAKLDLIKQKYGYASRPAPTSQDNGDLEQFFSNLQSKTPYINPFENIQLPSKSV
jgi:hypothetical protein